MLLPKLPLPLAEENTCMDGLYTTDRPPTFLYCSGTFKMLSTVPIALPLLLFWLLAGAPGRSPWCDDCCGLWDGKLVGSCGCMGVLSDCWRRLWREDVAGECFGFLD